MIMDGEAEWLWWCTSGQDFFCPNEVSNPGSTKDPLGRELMFFKSVEVQSAHDGVVDEAHFWLNGYVNKQNCRIWSEANPQVYIETPLHPEKLTVWCALWAGGILLQKR
ncbi:uncharacterized protein TNCV_3391671 [Trichonephila clavipes]|nr:uncharacterized protein TNCV_3391671 [Trichonephila clavipes]